MGYTITTSSNSVESYLNKQDSVFNYEVINSKASFGYSHVVLKSKADKTEDGGEFIILNAPSYASTRKAYLEIIKLAELNRMNRSIRNDGSISISDIMNIIRIVNNSPYQYHTGIVSISIVSKSVTDMSIGYIECMYRFPVDNVYMIVRKSRPNTIEIMSS